MTVNSKDINLHNISLYAKSYKNILIHGVGYKTPYDAKPLRIIFDKVDGYIRKCDASKYI